MTRSSATKRRAGALVIVVMLNAVVAAQVSGIAQVLPSGTIPGPAKFAGDTFAPGFISIWIKPGYDIHRVIREHGDREQALTQAYEGTFDAIDIEVGVDRFYNLSVPIGREQAKAAEYARDRRIQVAQTMGLVGGF
jgi:hypothetical protein